jgi:hypothetical protein
MFTPSESYWKDLSAYDAKLHETAQSRAGGWCRHDAQELWRPVTVPDLPDIAIAAEKAEEAPDTRWHGWHIWGTRSVTGHLEAGETIEPNLAVNPNAKPRVLRTTYTYSFNRFPFPGGNHVKLTRHTDQTPDDPRPEGDMNKALSDTIEESKTGMTALHVPEKADYELLLSQMMLGASGISRVLFEEKRED